jgi:hypothetical protein
VVFLGGVGKDNLGVSIGVDMKNGHKGIFGDPVVHAGRLSTLEDRLMSTVQPDPGFKRVSLVVLGMGRRMDRSEANRQDHHRYR